MEGVRICHMDDPEHLAMALEGNWSRPHESIGSRLRRFFIKDLRLKFAAFGLAGVICGMSFLAAGTTIRTFSIPIEFNNVPSGMEVTSQSADTLEIQVRANPWIIDSIDLGRVVGRFDLGQSQPGWHALQSNRTRSIYHLESLSIE